MTPTQLEVAVCNAEAYSRDVCGFGRPNMKFIHVRHTGGIRCRGSFVVNALIMYVSECVIPQRDVVKEGRVKEDL